MLSEPIYSVGDILETTYTEAFREICGVGQFSEECSIRKMRFLILFIETKDDEEDGVPFRVYYVLLLNEGRESSDLEYRCYAFYKCEDDLMDPCYTKVGHIDVSAFVNF